MKTVARSISMAFGVVVVLAVAAGCADPDLSAATSVEVLAVDSNGQRFVERSLAPFTSVEDLRNGRSRHVEILVDGIGTVDGDALTVQGGSVPWLDFHLDGETLVGKDESALLLATFLMVTADSAQAFQILGLTDEQYFDDLLAFFEPYLAMYSSYRLFSDNAAYLPDQHALALFESDLFDGHPMMANPGVVGHELGHGITARLLGGTGFYEDCRDSTWVDKAHCRVSHSLDEGWSDVYGYLVARDPDYLRWTAPGVTDRNMADAKALTSTQLASLTPDAGSPVGSTLDLSGLLWDPHIIGGVWAAGLWAVAEELVEQGLQPDIDSAMDRLAVWVRDGAAALGEVEPGEVTLATAIEALYGQGNAIEQVVLCRALQEPFALIWPEVESCGS